MDKTQTLTQKLQRMEGVDAARSEKYSGNSAQMSNFHRNLHRFTKYLVAVSQEAVLPGFLDRFDQRGNNLKEIADDAVISHLEDRSVGILVNRNDDSRAFIDEVLIAPEIPTAMYIFGPTVWPEFPPAAPSAASRHRK